MKKYLVNYATPEFYSNQEEFSKKALGKDIDIFDYEAYTFVDGVFSYTDKMLKKTKFYKKNKITFNETKGGGLWLWKPYVILEAMKQIEEGDALIYADASAEIINPVDDLITICYKQGGILLFSNEHKNSTWTKRDCFVAMDCDNEKYWNAKQAMGGFQIYIKNERSIKFIEELLKFCQMRNILTDQLAGWKNKCGLPDLEGFRAGRNDQSVLSNLAVKYNLKLFRDPSQNGNHLKLVKFREKGEWLNYPYEYSIHPDYNSPYPTIFYNHRGRNSWIIRLHKIHSKLPRSIKLLNKKIWDCFTDKGLDI